MLIRLLIFAILGLIIYRAVKSWLGGSDQLRKGSTMQPPEPVDDVMIQDPFCGIYFPKRDAVALTLDNRDFDFCSTKCRDRYLEQQSEHQSN